MKRIALLLATALIATPFAASAQLGFRDTSNALSISISPSYPAPFELVTLKLTSPVHDLERSDIVWSSGGKVIAEGEGLVKTTVTAGAMNTSMTIMADVGNGVASAETVIAPTAIELLWEADTYVPPFYLGRSLPSAGASVRLMAIPRFLKDGKPVPANQIRFTWMRNDGILVDQSGRGRTSAVVAAPYLYSADIISVQAETVDGTISGEARVRIPSVEPVISLYGDHPVFGTMYFNALGGSTPIAESEMSFIAEPYFVPANSARSSGLTYDWRVNNVSVAAGADRPNALTIDASNSSGYAFIELVVEHLTNFFLSAEGKWGITFTKGGGGTDMTDPFSGR